FDLVAAPLRPAAVHPEQHLGPVLALGTAGAGMNLEVGIVGVRFAAEQSLHLVRIGSLGEPAEAGEPFGNDRVVSFHLAEFHKLDRVSHFARDLVNGPDRTFEAAPFAHKFFRALGVVPESRILDTGVELVETAHRAVPVERAANQGQRSFDPIDMGLPFGTHGNSPSKRGGAPSAGAWLGEVETNAARTTPAQKGAGGGFRTARRGKARYEFLSAFTAARVLLT